MPDKHKDRHDHPPQKTPPSIELKLSPADQEMFDLLCSLTNEKDPAELAIRMTRALHFALQGKTKKSKRPVRVEINAITITIIP